MSNELCISAQTSISLRNGTVLQLQPTYFLFSHLEDLHNNSNPLYCNLSQSIQIDFRTKFNGQLTLMQIIRPGLESVVEVRVCHFYAELEAILQIINGTLVYSLKGSYRIPIVMRIHSIVNDGDWHRMQLALSSDKKKVEFSYSIILSKWTMNKITSFFNDIFRRKKITKLFVFICPIKFLN